MSSTISSTPSDGAQESADWVDSRNPSRQTSYHEGDVPAFSPPSIWSQVLAPPVNGFGPVQSLESIQPALSAPTVLSNPSPLPFYQGYNPLLSPDHGDTFAVCQQAAWCSYTSDAASVDLYHDPITALHRTDSTLSAEAVGRNARASFPVDLRSKSPWKADPDRASRSRSIVGVVTPPTDAGVKKLRKSMRGSSCRRNSNPLASSTANIKAAADAHTRRYSPAKEEVMSNDDVLSSEDEDSRHRPKGAGKEPTFACPFYRRWPTRHFECMNRKLTRIQDVKQHIYRRHSKPPHYCPTCDKVFVSPDPRDDHIRQASCIKPETTSSNRSSDGISAQVQDSLKNRFSRRLSPVEQWYGIWNLVFPGETPPPNAHVGKPVTEMLSMLEDFWKNEGQRILPSLSKPRSGRNLADADLQMLMSQMLDKVKDHFENKPGQTGESAADGTESQADQMIDSLPVDGESGTFAEYEQASYEPSPSDGWDAITYSPNGSPCITMGGLIVEQCVDLGSSGMLVEQHQPYEQSWAIPSMENPLVNRLQ
ncbi:hypothetical protein ISF_01277 [Cordyceps fumosorosea ARSEF 2679]|uniref:C2H2-type domain-containing protein n=1 Tax=Cordyceps fumosorosea (strain ARSEF 2679) TaxID=1081104 RepID=A0A162LL51_CORFA|nr:hypothetical protein ISF_01277 [Cordyceps fumosorosea ARSEF 2679]OAA72204.1 hypothetical protein ISF_01277 [Cordyceps fumosorosea ARSEF 2679]